MALELGGAAGITVALVSGQEVLAVDKIGAFLPKDLLLTRRELKQYPSVAS